MSPWSISSLIKNYFFLMCFFHFDIDTLTSFAISIVLLLSWYNFLCSTFYICASINFYSTRLHSVYHGNLQAPLQLKYSHLVFLGMILLPHPAYNHHDTGFFPTVLYEASTHHLTTANESTLNVGFVLLVAFNYFSTLFDFI